MRGQIVGASAVLLVLVLSLGVLAFSVTLGMILTQAATQVAATQVEQLAALVDDGQVTTDGVVTQTPSRGSVLQLLRPDGSVQATSDPIAADHPLVTERLRVGQSTTGFTTFAGDRDDAYAVAAVGLRDEHGNPVTLVAAAPLRVELRTVGLATALLAVLTALLAVLLLIAVWHIVGRALAPVERIRRDVARVSRAGGGDTITVPVGDDEIVRLARTMNSMLERLDRADSTKRRFVADASHELRSPLATLRTHVETSPISPGEAGAQVAVVDRELVLGEVVRLQRLVADLLTLARADDSGLVIADGEVDLDDVVDGEVRRLRATSGHEVRARIEPALVGGDVQRLSQVLRNLLDNADRHAERWVAVTMVRAGDEVRVHVDNDGVPIPESEREQIFDRFVRLDQARARDSGGSGLGLPIARALAEAHGGSLVADDGPDGVCRFTLTVPLAEG